MEKVVYKKNYWINIEDATEQDVDDLKKRYSFHDLDLEDCVAEAQRPKIDEYEKYLFIVLHFPYLNRKTKRIRSEQLSIFIGQDYVVTLSNGQLEALNKLFKKSNKTLAFRKQLLGSSTGHLLYEIVSSLTDTFYPLTDEISRKLKAIEDNIFEEGEVRDQLFEIMILKKNIITLRTMTLPQRTVVATLEHKHKKFLPESLTIYFDDIVDKIERTWNILESQKEVIESLEDTHEALLSHKINHTIRTLTVFSAIMLPLTFLTGLFGMNVTLPFSHALEDPFYFWTTFLIMSGVALMMGALFKWKKWL